MISAMLTFNRCEIFPDCRSIDRASGVRLLGEANRTRKRGGKKKEGEAHCPTCGSPMPELANFCPVCGQPVGVMPLEELLSRPLSEPPLEDVPEIKATPEEETALPPPSAVAPEPAGSVPALAAESEPREEVLTPEAGAVAEAPVSREPTEKGSSSQVESPLTQLVKEYDKRFNRIMELSRMLRGFDLGSDTYARLSHDILRSVEAFRAELRSRMEQSAQELDELETNRVELQISIGELERRRETEGLLSDDYREQMTALRSSLTEIENEINNTKQGLKDLEEWTEVDSKYETLCTRYPDLFELESRIEAAQEKTGDRRKAIETLFSETPIETQLPVETEAEPEVTVIGELPSEEAPTPPSPQMSVPEQRPVQTRARELLLDLPERGSQLLPLWLRRGDLIGVRFALSKRHLVSPISALLFKRETYSKLVRSGKPVSRKILEKYADVKSQKGGISYTSELEDFHYLLFLNSSSKSERVKVRYEIGPAEPESQADR